ncbi:MAG: RnfABCDGE type electron transport complex subunit G [Anaerovoracaceae bacterium]
MILVIICLVVTLALAGTYSVANPIIIQNQQKSADEARQEVAPDGDGFTQYDGKLAEGVEDCYIADKAGTPVTAGYKGFGGTVKVMIGIDADGKVTGVKVTEHSETPGLGTKAADPEYLKQYKGVAEAPEASIKDDKNVDAVTGATITSNAVYNSVERSFSSVQGMRRC